MAALQTVAQSNMSTSGNSYSSCKDGAAAPPASGNMVSDQFPAGLRVLVVDDDATTLKIIEQMSRRCRYNVTTCFRATVALNLLRERKGSFDVVLSDVHMPDMDGYKLLELVGLEMDLPVIMMSADSRTSAVMKGIRHGACDYLIKPVREEELKNIWQHVVRKKWNENKEPEHSSSLDDNDRNKRGNDEAEYTSSIIDAAEVVKAPKRRSTSKEDVDGDLENDDSSTTKKPRVVWSVELHQQFVSAVNQLGLDKAVPKRILELMNVPGLTRENVASHLQKFRLYLKRISGVAQQQNSISGPVESNIKLGGLGRFDIQALAATIPPQTLAALHAELYGCPAGNVAPTIDQTALLQASIHGSKHYPAEHGVAFGQPLVKCPSNVSKSMGPSIITLDDASPAYGAWPPSNNVGPLGPNSNLEGASPQNNNMMDTLQHRHQQRQLPQQMQQQQLQHQSTIHDQSRSINVQPSCLVVPSQSSCSLPAGNRHASVNQNCSFGRNPFIDYSLFSPQSNNSSLNVTQFPDGEINARGVLSRYNSSSTISPSASFSPINTDNSNNQQLQNSPLTLGSLKQFPTDVPNISDTQGLYCTGSGDTLSQGALRNLGFVGKRTSITSRFAAHEIESSMNVFSQGNIPVDSNANTVKEEPNVDFVDNSIGGFPSFRRY